MHDVRTRDAAIEDIEILTRNALHNRRLLRRRVCNEPEGKDDHGKHKAAA